MDVPTPHSPWLHVAAAGLLLTALNALKPVHMDDSIYLIYGAEFAAHPLDPYAFCTGSPEFKPANDVLVPPVLPYWLALGMLLLGNHPVLLRCWMFPFALALARAVDFLAARLAPSLRTPLLWLCVISPNILPGFNFMLEVPVLALGLTALAVAMRSLEKDSWTLTLLAGLLAGLAVETKYTGIISCAAIVVWCVFRGRPARGALMFALALVLVVGWECLVAWTQGESHFLIHLHQRQGRSFDRCLHLILPLLSHVAGLAPAVALLGLMALGWSRRSILAAALAMLAGIAVLALAPSQTALIAGANGKPILTLSNIVYGMLAVLVWTVFASAALRLARRRQGPDSPDRLLDWFLLAWLALEFAGYFALSPYPAARRVVGLVLVLTLMVGRLAHLHGVRRPAVGRLAACGAMLALLFFGTDLLDARAARTAAHTLVQGTYLPAKGGTFWHLSWWGLNHHADRAGLRPLRLNRVMPCPGDLLAIHDVRDLRQFMVEQPEIGLELIDTVVVGDSFPLQVTAGYYGGRTPLEHGSGERMRVLVYRIASVEVPPPPPAPINSGALLRSDSGSMNLATVHCIPNPVALPASWCRQLLQYGEGGKVSSFRQPIIRLS